MGTGGRGSFRRGRCSTAVCVYVFKGGLPKTHCVLSYLHLCLSFSRSLPLSLSPSSLSLSLSLSLQSLPISYLVPDVGLACPNVVLLLFIDPRQRHVESGGGGILEQPTDRLGQPRRELAQRDRINLVLVELLCCVSQGYRGGKGTYDVARGVRRMHGCMGNARVGRMGKDCESGVGWWGSGSGRGGGQPF